MATVLLLNAHTDDTEYSCGGTITRLVEAGDEMHYVAFSGSEEAVPDGLPKDILRHEVMHSTKALGIPPENVRVLNFQLRNFPRDRQAILDQIINLGKEIKPDIIIAPPTRDNHQDHRVIAEEALRVFKNKIMWHFEIPYKNIIFTPNLYIKLEENHLNRKIEAIQCYKSQLIREGLSNGNTYFTKEFITANAMFRGQQIGERYAECFEVLRWVIKGKIH